MNPPFDFTGRISEHDREIAHQYIGSLYRPPDLIIAPAGYGEYIFRWHVVPKNSDANVYFHIQTQDDPERPLHNHPWDNTSIILAGGYKEIICTEPDRRRRLGQTEGYATYEVNRKVGDVIHRPATWAHRLLMPAMIDYSMSLFTTGPKVHKWGFWDKDIFTPYEDVTETADGKSSWKKEGAMA